MRARSLPLACVSPKVQLTTACRNPVTDTRFGTVSRVELGYARVSTTKQDLDRQIDALTVAGIASGHIYVDKKSGATTDRPGLKALLDYARPGDVIVVHTLDRLGRTVRDTLNLIHQLRERGVGVRNLADPIRVDSANPDDPMAQLAVVLLALFAPDGTHLHPGTGRPRAGGGHRQRPPRRPPLSGHRIAARARRAATPGRAHHRRDHRRHRADPRHPLPSPAGTRTRTRHRRAVHHRRVDQAVTGHALPVG